MAYHLTCARAYPAGVAKSYARLLPLPLPELFCRRYGPMPRVREIRGQDKFVADAVPNVSRIAQIQ